MKFGTNGGASARADPSLLTTEAVDRATAQWLRELEDLKALAESERGSLRESTLERFRALRELYDEKIQSLHREMALVERQRVEQKTDQQLALKDALAAAEKAVGKQEESNQKAIDKTERAFKEQLTQQAEQFRTESSAQGKRFDDLKESLNVATTRLATLEAEKRSTADVRTSARSDNALLWQVIAVLVALAALGYVLATGGGGGS